MNTKRINDADKEMIEYGMALEKFKNEMTEKKYSVYFYTLDNLVDQEIDPSYIKTMSEAELQRLESQLSCNEDYNFMKFDGAFVNLSQFSVIEWEPIEEKDEE